MTTTLTVSTTAELNSAITEADAASSGGFVIDLAGNITQSASLDAIDLNSAVTLTINGSASTDFTLNGGGTYTGLDVVSAGGGAIIENLQLSDSVSTLAGGELAGTVTIASNATVGQTGQVTFGDATNGPATVDSYGTWDITGAWGITQGDAGSTFYNYGTMERDPNGVDGISHIYVDVVDTGTLSVPDNTPDGATTDLEFDGTTNSFSGIYIGGGMIDYGAGSNTLGNIDMSENACSTNFDGAIVHQNGVVELSSFDSGQSTITNNTGATWDFTSDNGIALENPSQIGGQEFTNYGTLEKTGGTGTTYIDVDFNPYGGFGSINIEIGTLAFDGPQPYAGGISSVFGANNSPLATDIYGAGIFSLGGEGIDTIGSTASITTSGWTITDTAQVTLNGAPLTYSGTFTEGADASLTLDYGLTLSNATIDGTVTGSSTAEIILASGAALNIGDLANFNAPIGGFAAGDVIDLTSIANVAGSQANMNYSTNVLTIKEGGNTYTLQFNPSQNFVGDYFYLASDNGGVGPGTDITEGKTPCYCRGTLIRTEGGEVLVEDLTIGDEVMTKSGKARPIKWIGRRSYDGRCIIGHKDVLPICIKADALDDSVPKRDLWLSPHHALYLDGVLIEAKDLVNGVSIVQADRVEKVEYFHIELETHDVIIADSALAESFIDDDSRGMFHNAHEYGPLYGEAATGLARFCAPRREEGYQVEAVRKRIALRAEVRADEDKPQLGGLRGFVDLVSTGSIEGWAQNMEHAEAPVCLDIYICGQLIGQVLANRYRGDLARAGLGSGRHGFVFAVPSGLIVGSDKVEVRRSLDDAPLPGTRHTRAAA